MGSTSIGLLELKSIPVGIEAADNMLKAANVEIVTATPSCPGKYIIIIQGNVGSVKSAINSGRQVAGSYLISEHIINNVHESISGAILGLTEVDKIASVGVIETISALSAVQVGDIVAKASNVTLMEIRIARGLGGKGVVTFTGEVSSVRSAVKACINGMGDSGELTSHCVIPSPHPDLLKHLN
ncbi:MAG: BMC domain-containing protein [Hespellia sp.]|nr:BMC domain-containing protein [Hespellia sp.]